MRCDPKTAPRYRVTPGTVAADSVRWQEGTAFETSDGRLFLRFPRTTEAVRLQIEAAGYYRFITPNLSAAELAASQVFRLVPGLQFNTPPWFAI